MNRERIKRLFTWGLALVALGFVVWMVPIRDRCPDPGKPCQPGLASTLAHARIDLVALLFVAYMASTWVWAVRWRSLLGLARVNATVWTTWRVTLEAQAGGVLLPGGVAGDALRIAAMVSRGGATAKVIASALLDRILGLTTFAVGALALAAFSGTHDLDRGLLLFMASIPAGLVAFWLLLRLPKHGSFAWLPKPLRPVLEYAREDSGTRVLVRSALLSAVVSMANLLVVRGLVHAVGAHPANEGAIYLGTTMSVIVTALPTLPGAWGTGDAAYVFFLGRAGIEPSAALAVCLLYRLFWYLSAAIGACLLLARRSSATEAPPTE